MTVQLNIYNIPILVSVTSVFDLFSHHLLVLLLPLQDWDKRLTLTLHKSKEPWNCISNGFRSASRYEDVLILMITLKGLVECGLMPPPC